MKVYGVKLRKVAFLVGVVVEQGKITKAHPLIGNVEGKSIEYVKKLVAKNKGTIIKVRGNRRARTKG